MHNKGNSVRCISQQLNNSIVIFIFINEYKNTLRFCFLVTCLWLLQLAPKLYISSIGNLEAQLNQNVNLTTETIK